MKKTAGIWLAAILCMIISVTVSADVQNKKTEPDYKTDYYMIVESKAGGIDIYANPDLESAKLAKEMIPNSTALHIEGEVEDKAHSRIWGYVQYHGMNGFVPLDDCRPAASRQEAIDSELYLAGRDNVNNQADYDITVVENGDMALYQGPGEKYGTVPGVGDIKSGETLHITQDAHMNDGSYWGMTTVDGKQGWVNLDKVKNPDQQELQQSDSTENSRITGRTDHTLSAENAKTSDTPDPAVSKEEEEEPETALPANSEEAGKQEETSSATSKAEEKTETTLTPSAVPDAAGNSTVTSTPKAVAENFSGKVNAVSEKANAERSSATSKKTESTEKTGQSNIESDKEKGNIKKKEETSDTNTENRTGEKLQETSGQTVKTSSGIPAPFLWIAAITVGATVGVLIYHFKKR